MAKAATTEGQAADISEAAIHDAEALIGVWLRRDVHWPSIAEPISLHDMRRWAIYAVGDDNPLWSDASYGQRSCWGGSIASPTFPYTIDSTIVAPGLPGVQWIYGGTRWEYMRPIREGDAIRARARLIGLTVKEATHVARMVIQTGETLYHNQRDELVARAESDLLRIPRRRSGRGLRGLDRPDSPSYSSEQVDDIRTSYLNETRRGSEPRYWDDVAVGEELPSRVKGPLTMVDLMAFYAGRRTVYPPLRLAVLERERHPRNVYVSPQSGIPVHPAAGHIDYEIAREIGMSRPYDQGWMRPNWLGHLLTDWMGDMAFLRRFSVKLLKPNLLGDTTWCRGLVRAKSVAGGNHVVELECWGENQEGVKTVTGTAEILLPSRAPEAASWMPEPPLK